MEAIGGYLQNLNTMEEAHCSKSDMMYRSINKSMMHGGVKNLQDRPSDTFIAGTDLNIIIYGNSYLLYSCLFHLLVSVQHLSAKLGEQPAYPGVLAATNMVQVGISLQHIPHCTL